MGIAALRWVRATVALESPFRGGMTRYVPPRANTICVYPCSSVPYHRVSNGNDLVTNNYQ